MGFSQTKESEEIKKIHLEKARLRSVRSFHQILDGYEIVLEKVPTEGS